MVWWPYGVSVRPGYKVPFICVVKHRVASGAHVLLTLVEGGVKSMIYVNK